MATRTETIAGENDFPKELSEKLVTFHASLESIEEVLQPIFATSVSETRDTFESLDRAKFDLVAAYALNSLFWIYLHTKGENPHEHGIRTELERIRGYMNKVKEIMDKARAPRLNTGAAKRFVTSSLWTPKDSTEPSTVEIPMESTDEIEDSDDETSTKNRSKRRKH